MNSAFNGVDWEAVDSPLGRVMADIGLYSRTVQPGHRLRSYQVGPARAIVRSVEEGLGQQFAVVFSRQAGKDEMLAQLVAYLLTRQSQRQGGGRIVLAAPTLRPQAMISRDRLLERLGGPMTCRQTRVRDGAIVEVGRARAHFVSAAPTANARGQTADLLLVANEAQDIRPETWDAIFDPMAASTNATTLFLGTVWSKNTLLARQIRHLEALERQDGQQRVWRATWDRVERDMPAYGRRVRERIAQLGPDHPFIRTEYCLQELDGDGGLFPPRRLAQMQGDHPRRVAAEAGKRYALLVDVAGEEELGTGPAVFDDAARRDSTALTVVEVVLPAGGSGRPLYRVVDRMAWTGMRHTVLHEKLVDLARNVWRASAVVVDATGVGAGLASFLSAELGRGRGGAAISVYPFVFTGASKSALGWDFLGLIESGRFKEYRDDSHELSEAGRLTRIYRQQLLETTYETLSGPGKQLRWSVPSGQGHDDLVISAALTAVLDGLDWRSRTAIGHPAVD